MLVRPRSAVDLAGSVTTLYQVHKQDGYPGRWPDDPAGWLSPGSVVAAWIAVEDQSIAGHVALAKEPEHQGRVEIIRLFTSPLWRGRGVGRALTEAAEEYARAHGWTVWLQVVAASTAAVAFYQGTGWTQTGATDATWTAADGTHPRLMIFERTR